MSTFLKVSICVLILGLSAACGKGSNDGFNGGGGGEAALLPQIDISGAFGLMVIDPSQDSSAAMIARHNADALKLDGAPVLDTSSRGVASVFKSVSAASTSSSNNAGDRSLQKTDSNGDVKSAITDLSASAESKNSWKQNLPKISTIAVSPLGDLYLHFNQPFVFEGEADGSDGKGFNRSPNNSDGWADGRHCQLFKASGGTVDSLKSNAPAPARTNLECLTYQHGINSWDGGRLSVFQFDDAGNVYFPGSTFSFGGSKMVVYKSDRETKALTEMINANICVSDFLVTGSGSLFYTGTSSCNGGGGNGGGFFRYYSSATSALIEIARDWWNFIYEPIEGAITDKAVFFGPDPTSATSASWNSACLFRFDPAGGDTTALRTTSVITCGNDIWGWVNMTRAEDVATYGFNPQTDWWGSNAKDPSTNFKTEFSTRCTGATQVFAGGGSQISAIKQKADGTIYVIGSIRKKKAGTLSCNIEIRGAHCKLDGDPDPTYTTATLCTDAGGTWVDTGTCSGDATKTNSVDCFVASSGSTFNRDTLSYNGVSSSICTSSTGIVSSANWWPHGNVDNTITRQSVVNGDTDKNSYVFRLNNLGCAQPSSSGGGDGWTDEYKGLAKVVESSKTLELLSSSSEQALKLWMVNDTVYYSSYSASTGKYYLKYYDGATSITLISDFEAYNVNNGGTDLLYVDGLDFSNNSYSFGRLSTVAPYTFTKKTGLTGTLKTMVILPE
ncbi:hypothetical protein WDW86_13200 [Bdellovibrionota bacterium FG-2]